MKLLFDENLSPRLVEHLQDLFLESVHVRDVGLASADDAVVGAFAASRQQMIITKDADFNQRAFLLGPPPKIIWLRVGNATTTEIGRLLREHHTDILAFESSNAALLALK